ncbi:ISAon1 family transposase N-terminal region protein [Pedobacter sp. MW01-1-1]|uniref:ISAon1 family transposase N-terminal region protein n=1 Tax=Pedobacter sp. MW01-1-1 TaxID=3383027 RepID=UPI003FF04632
MHDSFKALLPMIIPEGVSDYFSLSGHKKDTTGIHIYLEELNLVPSEYESNKLHSKGFFSEVILQDFPIRGQEVFLHVKRRRWLNLDTGLVVFRDWSLVAKGTRITEDFAAFLKAISR